MPLTVYTTCTSESLDRLLPVILSRSSIVSRPSVALGPREIAEHVRHDLHVPVRVEVKAGPRLDNVVIEHAQRPKVHLVPVLVVGKRKVPVRREPVFLVVVVLG